MPGSGNQEKPTSTISNPFLLNSAYEKVDQALHDVIQMIEQEKGSAGASARQDMLLDKFRGWRMELGVFRADMMGNTTGGVNTNGAGGNDEVNAGGVFED
jgi:hypothetical protein